MKIKNVVGKIVWVFGSSAAGKETFIRHIQINHPKELMGSATILVTLK